MNASQAVIEQSMTDISADNVGEVQIDPATYHYLVEIWHGYYGIKISKLPDYIIIGKVLFVLNPKLPVASCAIWLRPQKDLGDEQ